VSVNFNDNPCVFALTQVSNEFGCEHGELVTRRAGPDIACSIYSSSQLCANLYNHLKSMGLEAFDYEDDLTQVPHGIWSKIQFGGLLGLQQSLTDKDQSNIENIAALVKLAEQEFTQIENIPASDIVPAMKKYSSRKRKR